MSKVSNKATVNTNYRPIPLGKYLDGSPEWLGCRKHGPHYDDPTHPEYIEYTAGGSDVGVILGVSKFKTNIELFHQKTGLKGAVEKPMNTEALRAGHELEEFVANMFVRKMKEDEGVNDIEMWNDTTMYQHPHYPFALGNFDRRVKVNGVEGLVECKTTSSYDDIKNWKLGIPPKSYEYQCRYYMAISNTPFVYLTCSWGFTKAENAIILIRRDLDIEQQMMSAVADFIECCYMGTEPVPCVKSEKMLAEYYTRLYGEPAENAPAVELPDSYEIYELIEKATELTARKEKAEKALETIEAEEYALVNAILSYAEAGTEYATYRLDDEKYVAISLKYKETRTGFDEERLKAEQPDLYKQCLVEKFDKALYDKITKEIVKENKKAQKSGGVIKEVRNYKIAPKKKLDEPVSLKKLEIKECAVEEAV